jgi:A/G-specific adenine glycosylase
MSLLTEFQHRLAREGLSPAVIAHFRELVYDHFLHHGRPLPWRETTDPYRVLVAEVMLQQTQVERVRDKFLAFTARFPDFPSLATAPRQEVLAAWQGLGYNRRAIALQECAGAVVARHGGRLPANPLLLRKLPGIGPYTAGAIAAFAFDQPTIFIETNIRAVFIHCFCGDREQVADRELLPFITATLDTKQPRRWYNALMDYGVTLKKAHRNPARRSAHHNRQTPFAGSDRQLRGRLLKQLLAERNQSATELAVTLAEEPGRVKRLLADLATEGFVAEAGERYSIS